jgi:predicted DCC family thiol-disulfide oxidoreductase YuxK
MEKVLLIYDGDCRVCRFGMEVVRAFDLGHAFEFCPFGNPIAEERLAIVPEERRYESFHAATADGIVSGTDAARRTLEALPLGRIATLFGLHNTYPLIVRSRSLLGRLVPDVAAVVTCGRKPDARGNGKVELVASNGHGAEDRPHRRSG